MYGLRNENTEIMPYNFICKKNDERKKKIPRTLKPEILLCLKF